jgi:hypothetical protein
VGLSGRRRIVGITEVDGGADIEAGMAGPGRGVIPKLAGWGTRGGTALAKLVLPLDDADRELSDDRDDNGVL